MAPLGLPVVPEVKMMSEMSSPLTWRCSGDPLDEEVRTSGRSRHTVEGEP